MSLKSHDIEAILSGIWVFALVATMAGGITILWVQDRAAQTVCEETSELYDLALLGEWRCASD